MRTGIKWLRSSYSGLVLNIAYCIKRFLYWINSSLFKSYLTSQLVKSNAISMCFVK